MANIEKFRPKQVLCMEAYSLNPNLTYKELASICDISEKSVKRWMQDPAFINAIYDKFMEVSGIELPQVIQSMIREAKEGNVHAGRLVLEHYGKLERKLKIEIDSPFEKFLKADTAEYIDITPEESGGLDSISEVSEGSYQELPDRNPENNSPNKRLKKEKEQIIKVTKFEKDRAKEKEYQKNAYQLRKRAKAVGLELLPSGRHSKGKRKEWLKKLEQLEKEIC